MVVRSLGAMTTALEVRRLFNVTQETRFVFNGWYSGKKHVVEPVMAHRAEAVHRITAAEVEDVCLTAPPHGPPTDLPGVRDWRPDFPFAFVAHHVVEELGRLPTWSEFRGFCAGEPATLWAPAREAIAEAGRRGVDGRAARRAVADRVSARFGAFLREVHVVAALRERGLDVRVHPLADAVFRVDAWVDRLILNPRGGGQRSAELLVHAMPPFFFTDLGLTFSHRVGPIALAPRGQLDRAAAKLHCVLHPA